MEFKGIMLNEKKNNLKWSYPVLFHLDNTDNIFEIIKLWRLKDVQLPGDKVGDEGLIMKGHDQGQCV